MFASYVACVSATDLVQHWGRLNLLAANGNPREENAVNADRFGVPLDF